jgi:hypothetical protein
MKPSPSKVSRACICSIILFAVSSMADKPAKPPAAKDLVGVHVGYASDYDFYRLDLRSDSTGFLSRWARCRVAPSRPR